jgi:xanthine dehydrogenase small subunit
MEKEIKFILNQKYISTNVNPAKTLLDFIRVDEGLKGTKEGCREGDCGACTVLIGELVDNKLNYKSVNSCLFPMGKVSGKHIVTIEGLTTAEISLIQNEFNNEGATQCGFCTPGFVNSLTGYVIGHPELNREDAENAIAGNICRCTGYASIKRTVNNVIEQLSALTLNSQSHIVALVENKILPAYFLTIENRLKEIISSSITHSNNKKEIIVGGGTDLFVQHADALLNRDIHFIKDRNKILITDNLCSIGASITIEEFRTSSIIKKYFPKLVKQLKLFASLPIRNSATISGNLVNASPIGDSAIIFLALNAKLKIRNGKKIRKIPLTKFYKDYKLLDLNDGEVVEEILFPLPKEDEYFNFEKVSKRTHLDIATVNSAISIKEKDGVITTAFLSAGGVSPIPLYLYKTSSFLKGKRINSELVLNALEILQAEISPISDIRGSAEYKELLLKQLVKAHFIELFPEQIDVEVVL